MVQRIVNNSTAGKTVKFRKYRENGFWIFKGVIGFRACRDPLVGIILHQKADPFLVGQTVEKYETFGRSIDTIDVIGQININRIRQTVKIRQCGNKRRKIEDRVTVIIT